MSKTRTSWILGGLGLGVVAGFFVSVVQAAAFKGWGLLDTLLVYHLTWCVILGGLLGRAVGVRRGSGGDKGPQLARSTIGDLMIAVAVVAVILSAAILSVRVSRTARNYAQRAAAYAAKEATYSDAARLRMASFVAMRDAAARGGKTDDVLASEERSFAHDDRVFRAKAHYFRDLAAKYRAAARRPWRKVAPDPPEPE